MRIARVSLVIFGICLVPFSGKASEASVSGARYISFSGLGSLKIGMNAEAIGQGVEHLFGTTLKPRPEGYTDECWETSPDGGPGYSLGFMFSHDRLVRIITISAEFRTSRGVGVGSSFEDILKTYPTAAQVLVNPADAAPGAIIDYAEVNIIVPAPDGHSIIRFYLEGGVTKRISAGRPRFIDFDEGCDG